MSPSPVAPTTAPHGPEVVAPTSVGIGGWASRRWQELGRRPSGNDVPGTMSVVALALLATGLHLGLAHPREPGSSAVDLLGAACVAASVAAVYHVCARVGLGRTGRLVVVATFLVNPHLRGVVTDPRAGLLLAGLLAALAGLTRWATATRTPSGGELAVYVGVPASVAVFAGPEGWLAPVAATGVVAAVQLRRGHGARSALTRVVCVVSAPVLASGWWLVRSSVRGEAGSLIETAARPALSTGTAIALVCLVLTVPVLAGLARLLRSEQHRQGLRTSGLRDQPAAYDPVSPVNPVVGPVIPQQRGVSGPDPGSARHGPPAGLPDGRSADVGVGR